MIRSVSPVKQIQGARRSNNLKNQTIHYHSDSKIKNTQSLLFFMPKNLVNPSLFILLYGDTFIQP